MKVGYDITKKINAGFEYYGVLGPLTDFSAIPQQGQDLFAVTDLNVSPKWEINFGVGIGMTQVHRSPDREDDSGAAVRQRPRRPTSTAYWECQVMSTFTGISFFTGTVSSLGGSILKSESVAGMVPVTRRIFPLAIN